MNSQIQGEQTAAQNNHSSEPGGSSPQKNGSLKSSGAAICFDWTESLVIAVVVVGMIFTFIFRIVTVSGTSMDPNLHNADRLIISSWNYEPQQFDVVVLKRTVGLDEPIIKRVIATEGQRVYINYDEGAVYVDGEKLDETSYLGDLQTLKPAHDGQNLLMEFPEEGLVVPENHIFVLGDNRNVSLDSRYQAVGMVDERYILGKALFVIYPFNHIGTVPA